MMLGMSTSCTTSSDGRGKMVVGCVKKSLWASATPSTMNPTLSRWVECYVQTDGGRNSCDASYLLEDISARSPPLVPDPRGQITERSFSHEVRTCVVVRSERAGRIVRLSDASRRASRTHVVRCVWHLHLRRGSPKGTPRFDGDSRHPHRRLLHLRLHELRTCWIW